MKSSHMIGATPPRDHGFLFSSKNVELMRKAKIRYLRMPVPFPFADESMTALSEKYRTAVDAIRRLRGIGIETFGGYEVPSSYRYNPETGQVECVRATPLWVGEFDKDIFYERIERATEFVGRDLKDDVTWWQVANEPDLNTFIGALTDEQNVRYLTCAARGLRRGNPDAQCGINLAGGHIMGEPSNFADIHPYAEWLISQVYTDEGLYAYLGLDGYFGTWVGGEPNDWVKYIDDAARVSGKPVIINEWGYSTLQRGKPRTAQGRQHNFNSDICLEKDWDAGNQIKWKGLDHSEELQAEYVKECVKIFAEHPACIGNLYFQWQDQTTCWQCGEPDCPAECAWGCIRTDGTPKPGFFGLAEAYNQYFD